MGAFDEADNVIIPDPNDAVAAEAFRKKWKWEPHEMVILRGTFTAADMEAVANASATTSKKSIVFQAGSARVKLIERMVLDWTFARGGMKVPVTFDAIKRLPANYTNPILEKCDEVAQTMTEDEQEDFFPSVNGRILEGSIEMK